MNSCIADVGSLKTTPEMITLMTWHPLVTLLKKSLIIFLFSESHLNSIKLYPYIQSWFMIILDWNKSVTYSLGLIRAKIESNLKGSCNWWKKYLVVTPLYRVGWRKLFYYNIIKSVIKALIINTFRKH